MCSQGLPVWVTYPRREWVEITPKEAGLDVDAWGRLLAKLDVRGASWEGEVHEGDDWGPRRIANIGDHRRDTTSHGFGDDVGKPFTERRRLHQQIKAGH